MRSVRWRAGAALLGGAALLAAWRATDAAGGIARAGDSPDAAAIASAASEWQTLDPSSDALRDLEPFLARCRDARVVLLGETHGDGATYWAKARVVRALHQALGFNVLAFETSCFDAWQLRSRLARIDSVAAIRASHGSNPLWARAEVLEPLYSLLLASRDGAPPLRLFGLDCKVGAVARDERLGDDAIAEELLPFLRRIATALSDGGTAVAPSLDVVARMLERLDRRGGHASAAERAVDAAAIAGLAAAFRDERAALRAAHGDVTASFAELVLRGLAAHAEWFALAVDPSAAVGATFTNPRDAFMAEALRWYLDVVDPDARVIVWTGGFHGFAAVDAIEHAGAGGELERRHSGVKPLAAWLRERFGEALCVVGCTAWRGETGSPRGVAPFLAGPAPGSIEAALEEAGARVGALDLRGLPASHPLRQPQWCSALGLEPARADWSAQLDVLLYARATFLHSARREAGPPIDRVVEGARELDGRWPRAGVAVPRITVVEPLVSLLEVARASTNAGGGEHPAAVVLQRGLGAAGALQLLAPTQLEVRGECAGDLHASAPLTARIEGPFLGHATALALSTWRFDGPFAGTLRLHAAATVELRCNLDPAAGRVVARAPGVVAKLAGFTPARRLTHFEGAQRVELESSDLAVGTHRIGALEVVVARQE